MAGGGVGIQHACAAGAIGYGPAPCRLLLPLLSPFLREFRLKAGNRPPFSAAKGGFTAVGHFLDGQPDAGD